MTLCLSGDGVRHEFAGALAPGVGDEFIDGQRLSRCVGDDLQMTVAVDVPGTCGLDVAGVRDDVLGPLLFGIAGVLAPADRVPPPAAGDEVKAPVAVDIHRDRGEIIVVLALGHHIADAMLCPDVGRLVPPRTGYDIRPAVAGHIEDAGGFETFKRDKGLLPFDGHGVLSCVSL